MIGIHTCTVGVPILLSELEEAGQKIDLTASLDVRRASLKRRFEVERGYWSDFWNGLLVLDPDFFEAYLNISSLPWRSGSIEPKIKEFIYIAVDASPTHLYPPGLKLHIQNAFGYGASKEEVLDVFRLAFEVGLDTYHVGIPALLDIISDFSSPEKSV
jgi:alkylhydroperoxidase/carboxymuconolactone decarboxylase family protein YurZ